MRCRVFMIAASAAIAGFVPLAPHQSEAQTSREEIQAIVRDYLATHPDEVGEIVRSYLIKNPDVLREAFAELTRRRVSAGSTGGANPSVPSVGDPSEAIKSNADLLFNSARQVTLGNPGGDVTMVEFFDYNCGFCKRAVSDTMALLKDDPRLKVVLKEFPILGPGSAEAARVAVAVRMQDPGGRRYLAFHQQLLNSPGPANAERALAAASEQGLDIARLRQDMASDEVRATLEESITLARAVGIGGTPGYVIGDRLVPGAVGVTALKSQIESVRARAN